MRREGVMSGQCTFEAWRRSGRQDNGHGDAGASELVIATSERRIISTSDLQHGITILPLYYSWYSTSKTHMCYQSRRC